MTAREEVARPLPQPTTQIPARVLVVDDEEPIVAILSEVLRSAGHLVTGCHRPTDAVALCLEAAAHGAPPFDVLVTDFKMPDMDGITLFERLREQHGRLVGVLVTGFGNLALVQTAMRRGFSGILLKPFPLDRVTTTVERALNQRRLSDENERLSAILELHAERQNLRGPRSREDLAHLLARMALSAVGAEEAAVLLADTADRILRRPTAGASPWPACADAHVGTPAPADETPRVTEVDGQWRVAVPLCVGESAEGLLVAARAARPFSGTELDRLLLLAHQAALVLSHLRLFESRLREDKLALVGRMAGAISERVRRPLHTIVEALAALPDHDAEYVRMIRDETTRIETMCTELSDLVSGADALTLRPESLHWLVETLAHRVEVDLARQGIELELDVHADPLVALDERKLSRALHNLIKNATEAMPQGGRLRLGVRVVGAEALLEVEDTGCGMSPEVRARFFEPFFTQGKVRGTGLGGAVVRSVVLAHAGRIEVHSEPGRGTTFHLYLPLVADP
jgi:signal transduction histidine kinase/CheY-like chemotaxis protein